jgi:hypothetical protein
VKEFRVRAAASLIDVALSLHFSDGAALKINSFKQTDENFQRSVVHLACSTSPPHFCLIFFTLTISFSLEIESGPALCRCRKKDLPSLHARRSAD